MRGAAIVIVLAVALLIAFRLWIGTHEKDEVSRTFRIMWRAIDVILVIVGAVAAIFVIILLVILASEMVKNVT